MNQKHSNKTSRRFWVGCFAGVVALNPLVVLASQKASPKNNTVIAQAPAASHAVPNAQTAPNNPVATVVTPSAPNNMPAPSTPVIPPLPAAPALPALPVSGPAITLDQVLEKALSNNSSVELARERYRRANEQIQQAVAQAMPQIRVDITDAYTSQKTSVATAGGGGASSGGVSAVIPTIIDQGGNTGSVFIGESGGTTNTTPSGSISTTNGGTPYNSGTSNSNSSVLSNPGGTLTPSTNNGTSSPSNNNGTSTAPAQTPLLQKLSDTETDLNNKLEKPKASLGGSNSNSNAGQHNNYAARLSVTQPVDIFGYVPASVDVLRRTREFYGIDLQRVTNEVTLSIKSAFYNVLRAQAAVAVQQEQVKSATENVRIAEARFNQGVAAQYDVLTAQANLSNVNQQLLAAQNQLNLSRANLNSLLGQNLDTPINLAEPALPPLNTDIDLSKSIEHANVTRPELKQADNNIVIAERLVKIATSGMAPSLSFSGSASYAGPQTIGPSDNYSISANFGIPLYDGGTTRSRVQSAKSDLHSQKINKSQLLQNVALEVRQAYLSVMDARNRMTSSQLGVNQAAEALRLAQLRYENGRGTFLDVTNAQAQLATARNNFISAQYDYQTAFAQFTRAIGDR